MPYDLLIKLKKFSPLRKKQLLLEHSILHAWWRSLNKGKNLIDHKTGKPITKEEVIKRHKLIVAQIFKAGMCHHMISTIDQTLPKVYIKMSQACSKGKQ